MQRDQARANGGGSRVSLEKDAEGLEVVSAKKARAKDAAKYKRRLGSWVRVSRYKISVVYVEELTIDDKALCGIFMPDKKIIMVDIGKGDVEETLLHEVFHAELHYSGVNMNPKWDHDLEETVVELLSRAVVHTFRLRIANHA